MDKNLTLGYAGIQCFFWMGFAAISGFASVFLLDAGFTNTQIGIIIAAAGSVSALLQPVAATVAESGRRFGLKELLCIAGVLVLLMGAGLAASLLRSPQDFSFWENRMLASLPEPAPQSVGDGGYFTQLERYLADHAACLLAVYNGEWRRGTAMTVRYARKLGREVIILNPA